MFLAQAFPNWIYVSTNPKNFFIGVPPRIHVNREQNKYILKYKILRARRAPIEQQIEALEGYKKAEYIAELLEFREAFPSGNNAANLANYKLLKDLYDRGNL